MNQYPNHTHPFYIIHEDGEVEKVQAMIYPEFITEIHAYHSRGSGPFVVGKTAFRNFEQAVVASTEVIGNIINKATATIAMALVQRNLIHQRLVKYQQTGTYPEEE